MKKIVFCLLLVSFTLNVSFAKDFKDVKKDDWFYDNLKKVVEEDVIDGYPDNTFKPDNKFTGNEFIAALIKSQDIQFNSTGKDWAKPYLKKAKDLKYLDENKNFDLDKTLSRENMAYIISNFLINEEKAQLKDINFIENKIKDNEKIDKSLRNRVYLTFKKGIILGYPDKSYKPKNGLTRAEGLTVIKRIIDKSERKEVYKDDVDIVYNEDTDTYTVDTEGIGFSEITDFTPKQMEEEHRVNFGIIIDLNSRDMDKISRQWEIAKVFLDKKVGKDLSKRIMDLVKTKKNSRDTILSTFFHWKGDTKVQVISKSGNVLVSITAWEYDPK